MNVRTYQIRTFGCQMNLHDSERLAGLLEQSGYQRAAGDTVPDVVVFNTCAVRENADNRLYGNLGQLLPVKTAHPGMQIAVGGCLAQKDRAGIAERAPWVDVVFGTHNIGSLPALLQRAQVTAEAQVEIAESLERFPSVLPARRESPYAAWVAISVGCNNTCTFCIVPSLRGREEDRRPGDVLAEVAALAADGVLEVTLLGQNVNSYGAGFGDRTAFGKLLRACGEIDGLERVRFTSPHPRDFTDDVITAMAETGNVMPSLHMPLQSGSDTVLRAMRRSYRRDKYLGILGPGAGGESRVRPSPPTSSWASPARPSATSPTPSTSCGRPSSPEPSMFQYNRVAHARCGHGRPRCPRVVVADRYDRLAALVAEIAGAENQALVGHGGGPRGRGGGAQGRGHAPAERAGQGTNRLRTSPRHETRPGVVVTTVVTRAAPHYLIADGAPLAVRRTRGGDAWQARQEGLTGVWGAGRTGGTPGHPGLPGSVAGPGAAVTGEWTGTGRRADDGPPASSSARPRSTVPPHDQAIPGGILTVC